LHKIYDQSIYYSASSLYMFRVSTTPIIGSIQNCNYSLRYCGSIYLPPTWPSLVTLEGGSCTVPDDKGLVNYITSECQTEIIINISYYSSNNTYRMNNTIYHIPSNIPDIQYYKLLHPITKQRDTKKSISFNKTN